MRALICFVGAALVSVALSSALSGCPIIGDGDCSCPETPERPALQDRLVIKQASAYSPASAADELPVDPRGGTVEITDGQLVVRYQREGIERSVTYDVSPL